MSEASHEKYNEQSHCHNHSCADHPQDSDDVGTQEIPNEQESRPKNHRDPWEVPTKTEAPGHSIRVFWGIKAAASYICNV